VVTTATMATGLRAAQTRSICGNLKRGYAEAVRDGETPAYKYHPNARIAAEGRHQGAQEGGPFLPRVHRQSHPVVHPSIQEAEARQQRASTKTPPLHGRSGR
jgi:hypothetical protein